MIIKCVVSCRNSEGCPVLVPYTLEVSEQEVEDGEHYECAQGCAHEDGYEDVGLVYDENDGPAWLFENLFGGKATEGA